MLLTLTGCLPDIRTDLALPSPPYRIDPRSVMTEYRSVPGFAAPGTPRGFNRSFYLRYYSAVPTRTILLSVPGIYAGAANFDILARQLVAAQPGLEVWATARCANAFEDRSALIQSLRRRDPEIAYRYYVTKRGTPAGFSLIPP